MMYTPKSNDMSFWGKVLDWFEKLLYLRTFHYNKIYSNKEGDILIFKDKDEPILKIFIRGMLYNLPTNLNMDTAEDFENYEGREDIFSINASELPVEELQELIKEYEVLGEYEKCAELRDIIKEKTTNEKNN